MSSQKIRRHELLQDMADTMAETIAEFGITDDKELLEQIGAACADRISKRWGGTTFVFPKDHRFRLARRDRQIYSEFNGTNHMELAHRYNLSERHIYDIVKRAAAENLDYRQGKLF